MRIYKTALDRAYLSCGTKAFCGVASVEKINRVLFRYIYSRLLRLLFGCNNWLRDLSRIAMQMRCFVIVPLFEWHCAKTAKVITKLCVQCTGITTLCPEKVTPCVLFYNSGKWCFYEILHQQCNIELQTNCKISVKSVYNCNSYGSGFSAGTQKLKCSLLAMAQAINCQNEEISNNKPA